MKILEPSLLAFNVTKIPEQLKALHAYNEINTIHYDVMDEYVNNTSYDIEWIQTILDLGFRVNTHLMVYNPIEWINRFCQFELSTLTFQFEAISIDECIICLKEIKKYGVKCGIAIKPYSTPDMYEQLLRYVDIVTIMTVEPGKGGQTFNDDALVNLDFVHKMRDQLHLNYLIEVDGGIKLDNVAKVLKQADCIVSGTGFMQLDDEHKQLFIKQIKEYPHGHK